MNKQIVHTCIWLIIPILIAAQCGTPASTSQITTATPQTIETEAPPVTATATPIVPTATPSPEPTLEKINAMPMYREGVAEKKGRWLEKGLGKFFFESYVNLGVMS